MAYLNSNDEVIIYGAGKKGQLLYYKLKLICNVKGFVDGEKTGDLFGVPVIKPEELKTFKGNAKIIISSEIFEKEMIDTLYKMGYKFGKDFMTPSFLDFNEINFPHLYKKTKEYGDIETFNELLSSFCNGRKVVLIHGNCQTWWVKFYLKTNKEFTDKYIILSTPRICSKTCLQNFIELNEFNLFNYVDLFITQQISDKNRFALELSTNSIISLLRPDCQIVKISNLYFSGYFPQSKSCEILILSDLIESEKGIFPFGDSNIDKFLSMGYKTEEIISMLKNEDFYTKEFLEERAKNEIETFRKIEEPVDVKMADYIEENYKKELLFLSSNHPIAKVIMELTRRLLAYLGNENIEVYYTVSDILKGRDEILYPSVIKAFNLDKNYNYMMYYLHKSIDDSLVYSFDNYIRAYIGMCYGK